MRSAVSLFSGAGGMDVGFAQAGFRTLSVSELDATACATLNRNRVAIGHIGNENIRPSSVKQLDLSYLRDKDVDVVFGGPPCQGFSVAGKMDPTDERSQLVFDFMNIVRDVTPKAFVMENVKALGVSDRWQAVRSRLRQHASRAGYQTTMQVLTATEYGVPQARERMFLIGVRNDLLSGQPETLDSEVQTNLQLHEAPYVSLKELIQSFGPAGTTQNPKTCTAKIAYAKSPILRKSPYAGMLFNGAGRPIPINGASPTLPASMGGNKTPIVDESEIFESASSYVESYHRELMGGGLVRQGTAPERLRRLTIRECAAIQTFPDSYDFQGSKSSIYKQIGNAVPCRLAQAVASAVEAILAKCEMNHKAFAAE